jgi:hypothetical protein
MPSGPLKPSRPGPRTGRSARRVVGSKGGRSTYGRVSVDAWCGLRNSLAISFRDGSAGRGVFASGSSGNMVGRNAIEPVVATNA